MCPAGGPAWLTISTCPEATALLVATHVAARASAAAAAPRSALADDLVGMDGIPASLPRGLRGGQASPGQTARLLRCAGPCLLGGGRGGGRGARRILGAGRARRRGGQRVGGGGGGGAVLLLDRQPDFLAVDGHALGGGDAGAHRGAAEPHDGTEHV